MCDSTFERRFISSIAEDRIGSEDPIRIHVASYRKSYFDDRLFRQHEIELPDHIFRSVPTRRAEYLAGRIISKVALKQLNSPILQVGTGEHRSPTWPTGIVGSISHDDEHAICAVRSESDAKSVGVDIEPIICESVIENIRTQIISEDEYKLIVSSTINHQVAFTLFYSAKEALFKAIYPFVKRYLNFNSSKVVEISKKKCQLKLLLNPEISEPLFPSKFFNINFSIWDDRVVTVIEIRDIK